MEHRFLVEYCATWWAWAKWLIWFFWLATCLFTVITFFTVYYRNRGENVITSPNNEGYLGYTKNHISGLFVAPWHQKKGIGKKLSKEWLKNTPYDTFTYKSHFWFNSDNILYNKKIKGCKTEKGIRICPIPDHLKKWANDET